MKDHRQERIEAAQTSMIAALEHALPKTHYIEPSENRRSDTHFDVKWVGTDEVLGVVDLYRKGTHYFNGAPNSYRLHSKRIPSRSHYRDGGNRIYTKVSSAAKGIVEFCKPETNHEQELVEIAKAIDKCSSRLSGYSPYYSPTRAQRPWTAAPSAHDTKRAIELLSSDSIDTRKKGEDAQGGLIKRQRANNRYVRRINAIIRPLRERENELIDEIKRNKG